ncbi:polysaccharide biosynthesis protein [Oceaniovalibus guishaninsula JLT2003]|uniref:Polysaccharide biosynthesis protein n=1 Tax=Oceaniovalibus guishaninsula JLT2003 TaxID=1231392 RepID=K2I316_9RHOB|nr:oligosaccharide flippase family protein [Oceaniovalibus guishaninsula]EKE43265.1 polysaccharide biosynthesis protein [Oceaniovalibus guishaninsula JLT2003]
MRRHLAGDGVKARALRGTIASLGLAGSGHVLRFVSNLVLTRLLFPEAFGLMALVQVIVTGLSLMTTFGLHVSVMQNPRGDEPNFLNTAWTLQAARGVVVWLAVCALAVPAAQFYAEPLLAQLLPVAAFGLVIAGLHPTKVLSAQRHLRLGRYSALNLAIQVISLIVLALMAWWLHSVWALVLNMVFQPILALAVYTRFLPGIRNRFRLERDALREIFGLGKFLFISTIATYLINQSDRAVLGRLIDIEMLGIYSIGFALATLPLMLAMTVYGSVVFPLYRMRHPADDPANRPKIFASRRMVAAGALALSGIMAFAGPVLVDVLYDDRYLLAGPIVALVSMAVVPQVVLHSTMQSVLAKGDSLRFMLVIVATALIQIAVLVTAAPVFGIPGAALAIGTAQLGAYPLMALFVRRYKSWDPLGDGALIAAGFLVTGAACWLHRDEIALLLP